MEKSPPSDDGGLRRGVDTGVPGFRLRPPRPLVEGRIRIGEESVSPRLEVSSGEDGAPEEKITY